MEVNVVDLVKQYQKIQKEIDEAVLKTIQNGKFILGENVKSLEGELANYCDVKEAIGVNSGTDALWLSLMAIGVGLGDEVIVPAFTIIVDASVVCHLKAKPVFVDIDPVNFNLDPNKLEEKITKRTKAIIVVHLFGQTAEMGPILEIAKRHNIPVIEDACQAIGAAYKNQKAGTIGDLGCFSFFPTKNLGAYGDGGLITTNNQSLSEKLRLLRSHGSEKGNKYSHIIIGHNSRLDEIQATVLRVKLKWLDKWNEARRQNAQYYNESLQGIGGLITPKEGQNSYHVYHQYTIRSQRRDQLQNFLQSQGITTNIYYPIPLHLQKALNYLGYRQGDFPESERAAQEVLSLPVYAELEKEKIDYVISQIKKFLKV